MPTTQSAQIAIVGMGGIFPGAPTLEDYWRLIASGMSAARDVPADRWALAPEKCLADGVKDDKVYSKRACLIDAFELKYDGLDIDRQLMQKLDPMFHLLLHAGRDAWQDCNTNNVDKEKTGIVIGNIALPTEFASQYTDDVIGDIFCKQLDLPSIPKHNVDARNRYVAGLPAGVLAHALNLGAGTYTLDAACASSLYAIKYAADALISGRVDCMLAGGLSRPDSQYTQMGFSQLHALSETGNCAPFSNDADGLVVGEGAGIIVMKRLEDALRDGDNIYACLAGSGLSNDIEGNLFLPATEGQYRAMTAAYEQSKWPINSVDLIECHGTGTPKGDSVEFNSLIQLWDGKESEQNNACVIGSVKSNVGHLLTGAGAAGIIKLLLSFKHQTLPPTANYKSPSTEFDIHNSPFRVLQTAEKWDKPKQHPRRAAISAFGFGGINAHLLLEEWVNKETAPTLSTERFDEDIAIVACSAHFGDWDSLDAVENRMFNQHEKSTATTPEHWYGSDAAQNVKAFSIDQVNVPIGRFRIPPTELSDCLPQQLLMLQVAADTLDQVESTKDKNLFRCGTYIGIGLDPNTCNFHFRWFLENQVNDSWGKTLDSTQKESWLQSLRKEFYPPLTANRTMGALGGIVASRVARALRIGGPSFTISNEECSGMQALQMGVDSLRRGEIDQALVGAVDFASEIRSALSHNQTRPIGDKQDFFNKNINETILGDGACAFLLKRLSDAERDGDKIYACVKDIYTHHSGDISSGVPDASALRHCLQQAYQTHDVEQLGLLMTHGSGDTQENALEIAAYRSILDTRKQDQKCAISNSINDVGHCGAASALASVLKATLSLRNAIIPQSRHADTQQNVYPFSKQAYSNKSSHYWMRNRKNDIRHAGISSISCDGNAMFAVLSEYKNNKPELESRSIKKYPAALFLCNGENKQQLLDQIQELRHFCDPYKDMHNAALHWWHSDQVGGKHSCSFVVNNKDELLLGLQSTVKAIETEQSIRGPKAYYLPSAHSLDGELAFVYPGSGNHFAGMGTSLSSYWPHLFANQDTESEFHSAQFADARFWSENNCDEMDHRDVIFGQVCLGTMYSDAMRSFGLKEDAIIGYSLGETAGFFSTRTWRDRDAMLKRIIDSPLFTEQLAGACTAVQKTWKTKNPIKWSIAVIDRSAQAVKKALKSYNHVYLLIINTPNECVIGGDSKELKKLVKELACLAHPIDGVTTVHCPVAVPVKKPYRDLHLFECTPPKGVRFYSGILGKSYEVNTDSAADSVVGQALDCFDYTKVIQQAYADGVRVFVEMGPLSSCTRMIGNILSEKEHLAVSCSVAGQDASLTCMNVLAQLHMAGREIDLNSFYGQKLTDNDQRKQLHIPNGKQRFNPVPKPASATPQVQITQTSAPTKQNSKPQIPTTTVTQSVNHTHTQNHVSQQMPATQQAQTNSDAPHIQYNNGAQAQVVDHIQETQQTQTAIHQTHERFINIQNQLNDTISQALAWQMQALQANPQIVGQAAQAAHVTQEPAPAQLPSHPCNPSPSGDPVLFDYNQCMEIAIGKLGNILPDFAEADSYPTRVRLPDEPLMLAHRIMSIEGEAKSMTSGRVITEHDIKEDAWYLDGGVIPTCIAVEAGQADLFLSGYLGIDFITKGQATYRLLDAEVTFHRSLPGPGEYIRYDIQVLEFFKQGDTYLFRFQFEATVNGELLLTMRKGIAGFFTQEELDAGKGVVLTRMDKAEEKGKAPDNWSHPVAMREESYSAQQLQALRHGDLSSCFGSQFNELNLQKTATIPDGKMRLVHRIKQVLPNGGRFGLGQITGEADIHPDDWFLTCHFCDDMVMPGTLMYECCLHTLRIFLMRMGWVGEDADIHHEPIPGIISVLNCRGQVLQNTKMVTYQLTIKEIGYRGAEQTPYCLADGLMFGDGKAIVHMKNMSLQIQGLSKSAVDALWSSGQQGTFNLSADPDFTNDTAIFNDAHITAFAEGKPSDAFGDKYLPFDEDRRIARLPRDPFKFMNRVTQIRDCTQWELDAGGTIVARYDVPPDAWYFDANEQQGSAYIQSMPFAVLLETALQPCGWLAGYLGSALTNENDIKFRNLGGKATQYIEITPDIGTLSTRIKISNVSSSGGMIIQNYDMEMYCDQGLVYKGDTVFGFFSADALANQIGIRDANVFEPSPEEAARGRSFAYPTQAPYPSERMRMISNIDHFDPLGGSMGLGGIIGSMPVNPDAWFFQAHFYQDPVIPGSLGLESFQQLLKVVAFERWGNGQGQFHFESMQLNQTHSWIYRGQVVPKDKQVFVKAEVTSIDDDKMIVCGRGHLLIDGRVIYQMIQFSIQLRVL